MSVFDEQRRAIEARVHRDVDSALASGPVSAAMHQAVAGGHRWRALLMMGLYQGITGRAWTEVLDCASALELIHASSLVVDDLPCIDNAQTRRGVRACHRLHGEAVAIYASHVLVAQADRIAASRARHLSRGDRLSVEFANGRRDLVKGQMLEVALAASRTVPDEATLLRLCALKGVLFRTAGAVAGRLAVCTPAVFRVVLTFSSHLGAMYQIADDIADATQLASVIGKPVRADAAKRNLVTVGGPGAARSILEPFFERILLPLQACLPAPGHVARLVDEMRHVGVAMRMAPAEAVASRPSESVRADETPARWTSGGGA